MNSMNPNYSANNRGPNCSVNQARSGNRTMHPTCPSSPAKADNPHDSMNRMQLLNHIHEVSFAIDDILLYLDTHPFDRNALSYACEKTAMRKSAIESYARRFAPLIVDQADDSSCDRWEWILQPWPWEPTSKGGCK